MALFKCKMCGASLEVNNNESIATCEFCGMQQTLPRLDDEKRANMYDRANHFRRNNEFDKAAGIYEQILNEEPTDGEAYWSLVLCRYGIEYVEDLRTHKRIPTVNRAQFTSKEKEMILATEVSEGVEDKLFLLSMEEAQMYFENNTARKCKATTYVIANGQSYQSGFYMWWLRDPGTGENYAACIDGVGKVDEYGHSVVNSNIIVRPAMWIDLNLLAAK